MYGKRFAHIRLVAGYAQPVTRHVAQLLSASVTLFGWEALMEMRTRRVTFALPEDLAVRVEELAKRCGVNSVDVVCVALKMVTDVALDDEGLKYLQDRAPTLKPGKVN
jgi:hypothetical protein